MPCRGLSAVLNQPLVFVDIEVERGRIIEICAWRFEQGRPVGGLSTMLDPGLSAFRPGWRVHGLRLSDLTGSPSFVDISPRLRTLLDGATLVAHNASFERRHLLREFASVGVAWSPTDLCTLKMARLLFPDWQNAGGYSLGAIAKRFGVVNPAPHRATGDTWTLWLVFLAMVAVGASGPELARVCRQATRRSRV